MREGNLFSAFESQDGSQWTVIGTDTIVMPATVYVGLAVTSHNASLTATGTFSNVAVSTPASYQQSADGLDLRSDNRSKLHGTGKHRH